VYEIPPVLELAQGQDAESEGRQITGSSDACTGVLLSRVAEQVERARGRLRLAGETAQQKAVVEREADHRGRHARDAVQLVEPAGRDQGLGRVIQPMSFTNPLRPLPAAGEELERGAKESTRG
jgi:hypothetical protein